MENKLKNKNADIQQEKGKTMSFLQEGITSDITFVCGHVDRAIYRML